MAIPDLSPTAAYQLLQTRDDSVLIDVRSRVEYTHVGHPVDAIHVAWKEAPGWKPDPDFVTRVREALDIHSDSPEKLAILTLCRSGQRSLEAAQELERAGFQELYNVAEGFEGDKDDADHRGTRVLGDVRQSFLNRTIERNFDRLG